jgi:hypothetical protein
MWNVELRTQVILTAQSAINNHQSAISSYSSKRKSQVCSELALLFSQSTILNQQFAICGAPKWAYDNPTDEVFAVLLLRVLSSYS